MSPIWPVRLVRRHACDTPIIPGSEAKILWDGVAEAPADAPPAVQAMIAAGNHLIHFLYSWGGGHGDPAQTISQTNPSPAAWPRQQENGGPGYDCSSATRYVLWGGGFGGRCLAVGSGTRPNWRRSD